MKKVVFLFAILILSGLHTTSSYAILGNGTYEFEGYDIIIDYFRDENRVRGYYIEKFGENPFFITYQRNDGWIEVENVTEIDGNHVILGRVHQEGAQWFYKAYMMIVSPQGEILQEIMIEKDYDVQIEYLYKIDGTIMGIMGSYLMNDYAQTKNYTIFTMDSEYNVVSEIYDTNYYHDVKATPYMIVYNLNYDDEFDGGYTTDLSHISTSDPILISTDEVFDKEVYIPFLNQATLNGDLVEHGLFIDYPGNYAMVYQDRTYTFSVEPEILGVSNNGVYMDEIQLFYSAGKAYLNDDLISSGEYVSEPGRYTLRIEGINEYTKELSFTIEAKVEGILNNQEYEEEVTLDFNGTGYLNDTPITPPYTVTEPGEYVLQIKGENNYLDTYYFTVEEPEKTNTILRFLQDYDYVLLGITVISGFFILKKK